MQGSNRKVPLNWK